MSVGYLSIIIIRNKPSEVGLEDFDSDNENISDLYAEDSELDQNVSLSEADEDEDEEESNNIGIFKRAKLFLSYPFFVSICVTYFIVQLIKTLISDWAQVYLIQSLKLDPYDGNLIIFNLNYSKMKRFHFKFKYKKNNL